MALAYRETALGRIGIRECENTITHIFFASRETPPEDELRVTPLLDEAFRQLECYLQGGLKKFTLPLAPAGTPFQLSVWQALRMIPYGQTRSYKEIAEAIGNPRATRAVGMANNRNPIAVVIPCHRVIGADGSLVGYGGGLDIKTRLLELELSPR